MSHWTEIHNDYEDEGLIHIDAWTTDDDDENGCVIAKIDKNTREVFYLDERAKTDSFAQESINEALNLLPTLKEIKEFKMNYCWDKADKKWYKKTPVTLSEREQIVADFLEYL